MIRYAITDAGPIHTPGGLERAREALLADVRRWRDDGVDLIQLREKDLPAGTQAALAHALMEALEQRGSRRPLLLVNGRADVAATAGADGVHLTSHPDELTPAQVRAVFAQAGRPRPLVSVSCHTLEEVERARDAAADLILFGPVFEKRIDGEFAVTGVGLERLHEACELAGATPVLALGGVDANTAGACVEAGADGVAAIRMFAQGSAAR